MKNCIKGLIEITFSVPLNILSSISLFQQVTPAAIEQDYLHVRNLIALVGIKFATYSEIVTVARTKTHLFVVSSVCLMRDSAESLNILLFYLKRSAVAE